MSKVFVVINPELGWDNVVGIFDADFFTREELQERFQDPYHVFRAQDVDLTLENHDDW